MAFPENWTKDATAAIIASPQKDDRRHIVMNAEPGSYVITGHDANFLLWQEATGSVNQASPRIQFFFHLGFAISQWAFVDRDLFHVFRAMIGGNSDAIAAHLFFKSTSIADHFGATDVLVKIRYPDGKKAREWTAIRERFNDNIAFRNRLAHDPYTQIVSATSGTAVNSVPPPEWQLHTESAKLLRPKKSDDGKPITVDRIIEHIGEVERLQAALGAFRSGLP